MNNRNIHHGITRSNIDNTRENKCQLLFKSNTNLLLLCMDKNWIKILQITMSSRYKSQKIRIIQYKVSYNYF